MSTIKDDNFDYQTYVKQNPPVATGVQRGTNARKQRLGTAIMRFTIRVDEDILAQFQQLVSQDRGYERLINQALREWLFAKGVKELVREELEDIVHHALSTIDAGPELSKSKSKGKTQSQI